MRLFGTQPSWNGAFLLLFLTHPAQAEVRAYVDAQGQAHFAASQMDARYELFYRGQPLAETGEAGPSTLRPVAVPTAQARLAPLVNHRFLQ